MKIGTYAIWWGVVVIWFVVASTCLLIAAVHRITFLGGRPPPLPQLFAVWLSRILLGMIYDWFKGRSVHAVYLIGIAAVVFMKFGRAWIRDTDAYSDFTHWLAPFYT